MMRIASHETLPRSLAMCLVAGLLALGGAARCLGEQPEGASSEPAALSESGEPAASGEPGRIAGWVKQLDSNQFVAREMATQKLIEAGASVVTPIASALSGESLEVTTRGIYVLRELALSNDLDVQEAAQTALEEVAASDSLAAARRAADTLETLAGIRQERAINELRALGAHINATVRQLGFQQTELTEIAIGENWRGTPQDLRRLKWLDGVQQISFEGELVTDAFLEHVAGMEGLTSIYLKRTAITDKGFTALRGLGELRELDVKYTPIGDASLETLQQFKQLAIVKLYGTQMTREAAERLEMALPQAEIDFRRGAFLGVACDQPPMPCTVVQVVPNTAAARAGLLEGDVIVEYAGKKIADFNALKNLIGTNEPGDSVNLQVARGGATLRRIVRSGDDRFGVATGKSTPLGLEVTTVDDGSLAAQLQIRPGDVIRRFDERPVDTVDGLNQAYKGLADDQQAIVEFSRDVRIVKTKVTFGEWE